MIPNYRPGARRVILALIGLAMMGACAPTPYPAPEGTVTRADLAGLSRQDRRALLDAHWEAEKGDIRLLGWGDAGDLGTTGYGLWTDVAQEANPLLAPFGDTVPVAGLVVKWGLKHHLVRHGGLTADEANFQVNRLGMFATCSNLATLGMAAPPIAVTAGLLCATIYDAELNPRYQTPEGRAIFRSQTEASAARALSPGEGR